MEMLQIHIPDIFQLLDPDPAELRNREIGCRNPQPAILFRAEKTSVIAEFNIPQN